MKRARFTEEQIIGVLKENEAGAKTADPINLVLSSWWRHGGDTAPKTKAAHKGGLCKTLIYQCYLVAGLGFEPRTFRL